MALFVGKELCRSSLGRRSEFSRWNEVRYKREEKDDNLKKCTQIDYPTRSKLLEKSKLFRLPLRGLYRGVSQG